MFLGDIHKTNQILDPEGRVRYPGSTVQQNHGETNDKGFLIWEIEDKDTFSVKHHVLENPRPFVTIELTKQGRIPRKVEVPEGARLRLVSNNSIPIHKLRRAMDTAKTKFKPTAITFLNRAGSDRGNVDIDGNFIQEDLRDIAVQEKFFKEFLVDYEVSDEMLERIYSLNRKYNTIVEDGEDIKRNVRWKLKSVEWNNLFNYGENNKIDFEELNGVVGIFGKNFSGKSSIIDSLLYTVYNSTSKGNRKNFNTINQSKEWGDGKVNIDVGGNILTIHRRSDKYIKKLRGEETEEARTDINFWATDPVTEEMESLNGLDRNGTDKNIRKFFGTLDDFLLTSMASQLGSLDFIGEGSTKRKEILAKFLDLEIFDKKFKLAKDDAADLRGVLKALENIDFDAEIEVITEEVDAHNLQVDAQKELCVKLEDNISEWEDEVQELETSIQTIPAEVIDIEEVKKTLLVTATDLKKLNTKNKELKKEAKTNKDLIKRIDELAGSFDVESWKEKQEVVEKKREQMSALLQEIKQHEALLNVEEKKIKLLNEVPCNDQFPQCKFIRDAFAALESVGLTKERLTAHRNNKKAISDEIDSLQPDAIADYIEKHAQVVEKRRNTEATLNKLELQVANNKADILTLKSDVKSYKAKVEEYEANREVIENLGQLMKDKALAEKNIGKATIELATCETNLTTLYKESGSLLQKLEDLNAKKTELANTREEYASYDLFMRCVHTNGVSLDIIKNKLPIINSEIASVLANIVDFEIYVQDNDKKLELFIKHPKYEPRSLEMGSGAEKTIAAMAIRLALLSVTSLPKGDVFILDEPGTALDEENMEGFIRILDLIKTHFKTVLLISHLDSMKDTVDSQISIEKRRGAAYVNQ